MKTLAHEIPPISHPELIRASDEFFHLHWVRGEERPFWTSDLYTGIGHMAHGDQPGCYAIVRRGSIRYIGLAAGKGNARYPNFGLAGRTHNYLIRDFAASRAHPERLPMWKLRYEGDEGLYCIGFPFARSYLAAALESYLIDKFRERLHNKRSVSTAGR